MLWYNVRQQTRSPRNQTHSRQRSSTKRSATSTMRGHSRDRNRSRCATTGDGVQSQCAAQRWKKIVETNASTNWGLALPSEGTNGKQSRKAGTTQRFNTQPTDDSVEESVLGCRSSFINRNAAWGPVLNFWGGERYKTREVVAVSKKHMKAGYATRKMNRGTHQRCTNTKDKVTESV